MNPILLPVLVGGLVIAMVAMLYIAFSRGDDEKASDRLDQLVGRNVRKDSSADMLLKQALQEVDRKTLMDRLTPEFFNLTKVFEQADCNIKPSALFGISLVGGAIGGLILLATPSDFFAKLVPWLVLFATVMFAWGSFIRRPVEPVAAATQIAPSASRQIPSGTNGAVLAHSR